MALQRHVFGTALKQALKQAAPEMAKQWEYDLIKNIQRGGKPTWKTTHRGGKTLQKTGRLRNAVFVKADFSGNGRLRLVGGAQNLRYGAIMHYGGVIRPKSSKFLAVPLTKEAEKRSPRDWGDDLFFVKGTKNATLCINATKGSKKGGYKKGDVIAQYVLLKSVVIPARPYIVLFPETVTAFSAIIRNKFIYTLPLS